MISQQHAGRKVKHQLKRYLDKTLPPMGKVAQNAVFELSFGILKSGDVKVTNIARALEEPCNLKHTVKRLNERLGKDDYVTPIEPAVLGQYPKAFDDDTVVAIDPTDTTKRYARKMGNLSKVRDGDTGKIGLGYNHIVITANQLNQANPTVLAYQLFSKGATPHLVIGDAILKNIRQLDVSYGTKGVKVSDRGLDDKRFYRHYHSNGSHYVQRATEKRKLLKVVGGRVLPGKVPILKLANSCRTPHNMQVSYWANGKWHNKITVRIGCRKVFLPCVNAIITMVVIKGFGRNPMMLLTNIEVTNNDPELLQKIAAIYRGRWQCEEWIRFVKGEYNVEDIRSLKYQVLKNIFALVLLVNSFITKHMGYAKKLAHIKETLIKKAKPVFEQNAKFVFYRVSSGIRIALKNVVASYKRLLLQLVDDPQLELIL